MKAFVLTLIGLIVFTCSGVQAQDEYKVDPKEVATPEAILTAMYDVISGPAGQKRNWARMRALCKPDARLCAISKGQDGKDVYRSMSIDDYIKGSEPTMMKIGFIEEELGHEIQTFGNITQVFSAYKGTIGPGTENERVIQGINSYQLVKEGGRYWVTSILWTPETEDNPIPKKYLKKK